MFFEIVQHLITMLETLAHEAAIEEFVVRIDSIPGVHVR